MPNGLFVLVAAWTVGTVFAVQAAAWVLGQLLLIQDQPMSGLAWLLVTWGQGVVILPPLAIGAFLTRDPHLRAAYRTWAISAAFTWLLAFARFIPETRAELAMVAQGILSLAATVILLWLVRGRGYRPGIRFSAALPAVALAPLLLAPWVAFGAMGSPADVLFGLGAGLTFGLFAALLLDACLFRPLDLTTWRSTVFGGFSAGVALTLLASGFGFGGNQLLLMASLPSLGLAAAAMSRAGAPERQHPGRWLPVAVLVGLVTAGVLLFFDTEELTLLLDEGNGDIPTWAVVASGISMLLGWLAGVIGGLLVRVHQLGAGRGIAGAAMGAWALLLLIYFVYGQPGLHGDALFVILRDQADLSASATIANREERIRYVYSNLTAHASTSQASLRADLDRFGIAYRPYYLVNAIEVEAGPLVRLFLSTRPEVDRVLDSPRLRPLPEPVAVAQGEMGAPATPEWNITSIGAERAWRELGVTGRGIVVGQSDSGVEGTHPALRDGYRGRVAGDDFNWLDPWNATPSPVDISGHGTHTLGSVLGRGGIGVAPDAEWFGCVNLARNLGNPPLYLDCMQFMLAPYPQGADPFTQGDPSLAAHVTNNSWGCPGIEGCDATSLLSAAMALRAAGIFVAVSAGNSGPRCGSVTDPLAIYDGSFSVGAINERGNVTEFSSRGPATVEDRTVVKPDIVAPGENILSAFPGGSYTEVSGTSMAGPHVAGVVALMWSAQPSLIGDIERTEEILTATARPYGGSRSDGCFEGTVPNNGFGYGVVDAYAAVQAAMDLK